MAAYVPSKLTERLEGADTGETVEVVVLAAEGATRAVESVLAEDTDITITERLSRGVFIIEARVGAIQELESHEQINSLSMPDRGRVLS